jgi:hypothetical protein
MFLRLLFASFFMLWFASPSYALTNNDRSTAYQKTVTLRRTDPRMNFIRHPNCVRTGTKACDLKDTPDPFIHYVNTVRLQEEAKKKKVRPWL